MQNQADVIIVGAGASGLMCAIEAAKRHRSVIVLDHANKAGKKILMSGGGRCNFTNYSVEPDNFLSNNKHFCKSALSRYTQWDFLALIHRYQIAYHEREHGQLFCDHSARDILDMLLAECQQYGVDIRLKQQVSNIAQTAAAGFELKLEQQRLSCHSLVIATGGLSIPKMSASPFGYQVAQQFGIAVHSTAPGLVPFTLQPEDKQKLATLSGIAVYSCVSTAQQSFTENLLFTHRGLSGPVILQISSYWQPGQDIMINLLPDIDLYETLIHIQQKHSRKHIKALLSEYLPKRVLETLLPVPLLEISIADISHDKLKQLCRLLQQWHIKPNATEGYRTAEVTLGGVDCDAISSKTMQSRDVKNLYFIGEVLDVTGWLGGYNFQWAWSSGWCAGQFV